MPLGGRRAIYRNPFCSHRVFDLNILGKVETWMLAGISGVLFLALSRSRTFFCPTLEISLAPFLVWGEAETRYFRKAEKQPHRNEENNIFLPFLATEMATQTFVLPGDTLDPESLPSHPKLPLKLGPGLRHIPPNTIVPTVAGQLCTDRRKNAVWVEFNGSRVSLLYLIVRYLVLIERYSTSPQWATSS